ncbi:MAG: holo-ACP synthase [Candidatus Cloacimonetes bacterium]|nr:holo-ACP synthase [Candidatus Cloacimonadota bacterium]
MIYGTGTDMIEVARVARQVEKENGFKERIYSALEIEYCESMHHSSQHYAARFAAKEAYFKALGTGWRNGMGFAEVEVTNDELGNPHLVLHGKAREVAEERKIKKLHVSLTHLKDYANAIVILEK